jgi:hypothetical protein
MAGIKFECSSCGQHLEAPLEAADCALACPSCQSPIRVPSVTAPEFAQAAPRSGSAGLICAICQSPLHADDPKSACPACKAEYHSDCWQENGGCAIYGCAEVPNVEQRRAIEIPISYWGQENKPCPNCHREILAAAVRCRHCGATFSSARPEAADEFQDRTALRERLPGMKRTVIWIFVFSILPCLAPIGAIWGLIWYLSNRRRLGALPAAYSALCKIGLAVALGQCALVLFMAALYSVTRSL